MTMLAETRQPFRLSSLIHDTHYRAYLMQALVFLGFAGLLLWLGHNAAVNLEAKGRTFDFSFLWQRAGYDIGLTLIPFTNDNSHFRALLVGLLNTLVLAIAASVFATILGIFIGVLRLSKNWLISRLMAIYIDLFRNVPLLLWIVLIFVILIESSPPPSAYKLTDDMIAAGIEPAARMGLFGTMAITARGFNLPALVFDRPLPDISIGSFAFNPSWWLLLAIFLAAAVTFRALLRHASRIQSATGKRPLTPWLSVPFFMVAIIIALYALGSNIEVPALKGFNFVGGWIIPNSFVAMFIALSLYTAAFIAEIVRAGIQAVHGGQREAAAALGLRSSRITRLVVLPQALRVIIPPLISQYLNVTKNTSLGIAASYTDLRGTLGGVTLMQTGKELECMLLMMGIYLSVSLLTAVVINIYNASVALRER